MATTKIWDIKGRIDKVLNYAKDKEKTKENRIEFTKKEEQALFDVMNYIQDDFKTEDHYFVTGVNCFPDIAREQMMMTKRRFNKSSGNMAYHAYQSFKEGEVTAEQCHNIGVQLAKELWGDRFEVVVATHCNTKHYHNHFVLNSVSFKDGGKYNDCKQTQRLLQNTNDYICLEHGLSVVNNKQWKGKHYAEWRAEKEGKPTWRSIIASDVNNAIAKAQTWKQFLRNLGDEGYEIKAEGRKYVAVRPVNKERFVRLKTLGYEYTEEAIKKRILGLEIDKPEPRKKDTTPYKPPKFKGIVAMYFKFLYLLGVLPKRRPTKVHPLLKDDIIKAEKYLKEYDLLRNHKIETFEHLSFFREKLLDETKELAVERNNTYEPEKRKELNKQIRQKRNTITMCQNIYDRSVIVKSKLKKLEKEEAEKGKENSNESTIRRNGQDNNARPRGV